MNPSLVNNQFLLNAGCLSLLSLTQDSMLYQWSLVKAGRRIKSVWTDLCDMLVVCVHMLISDQELRVTSDPKAFSQFTFYLSQHCIKSSKHGWERRDIVVWRQEIETVVSPQLDAVLRVQSRWTVAVFHREPMNLFGNGKKIQLSIGSCHQYRFEKTSI